MSNSQGAFIWYELMTENLDAAKEFYTKTIGWKTIDWSGDDMTYTMFAVGERTVAGLMKLPEEAKNMGAPPHWGGYVGVTDTDATAGKAEVEGGRVLVPPTDIPEVGKFTVIADPQGAVLQSFTSASESAEEKVAPEVGDFTWHELATTDIEGAVRFYSALYGWNKTEAMDMGGGNIYQMFGIGEKALGGIFVKPPEMPAPPHWLFYIRVVDISATIDAVNAHGGKVLNGPMEVPGGDLVAQCMDPQGAAFAIHEIKA